jgi:riboflavin synthase
MFTGIVEELGIVQKIERRKNLSVLHIRAKKVLRGAKKGDSLAIDGVCLSLTAFKKNVMAFDIMRETLLKTTLGSLKAGSKVNLERPLKMNSRVHGHFVTGHIDQVGVIKKRITEPNYTELHIHSNGKLKKLLLPKGSVCLDGVSLTLGDVKKNYFSVYLIPHTKQATTLGFKKKGNKVNIEADILGKYILSQ